MSTSEEKRIRPKTTKHHEINQQKESKFQKLKCPKNLKKSKSADNRDTKSAVNSLSAKYMVKCQLCHHDMYQQEMRKKNPNWIPFGNGTMKEFKVHLKADHSKRKIKSIYYKVIGEIDNIGNRHYLISKAGGLDTAQCLYLLFGFLIIT